MSDLTRRDLVMAGLALPVASLLAGVARDKAFSMVREFRERYHAAMAVATPPKGNEFVLSAHRNAQTSLLR